MTENNQEQKTVAIQTIYVKDVSFDWQQICPMVVFKLCMDKLFCLFLIKP